jgi:hypothetical protein
MTLLMIADIVTIAHKNATVYDTATMEILPLVKTTTTSSILLLLLLLLLLLSEMRCPGGRGRSGVLSRSAVKYMGSSY